MSEEKICLVDLDGTLVDYEGQLIKDLAKLQSPNEVVGELWRDKSPDWLENRIRLIKSQRDWWFNLPTLPMGFDILQMVQFAGFKIEILTKAPRNTPFAWGEKLLWCQKNIHAEIDVHCVMNKGRFYGRVLVDDFPEYMTKWLEWRPRGLGIMPLTKHNVDFSHPNVIKYDGTVPVQLETARRLQEVFQR